MTSPIKLRKVAKASWIGTGLVWLLLSNCASTGDLQRVSQENEVQNQRLTALEQSAGASIDEMVKELKALRQDVRKAQGRLHTLGKELDKTTKEQGQLATQMERSASQYKNVERLLDKEKATARKYMTETQRELDGVRLQLNQVEKLIKTSLAKLPTQTQADKDFREAFVLLTGGQLDFAAQEFVKFQKTYPKDSRLAESLYRQGQALFLARKFEHALVPFYQVVEKHPKHKLAVEARWMLARGLEEIGDLKLARDFYTQLISENTLYKADATRRLHFINKLFPDSAVPVPQPPPQTETKVEVPGEGEKKETDSAPENPKK